MDDSQKSDLERALAESQERIRALENRLGESEWLDGALRSRTGELNERVKELECLYALTSLLREMPRLTDAVLDEAVELLPSAFQHAAVACAEIAFDRQVHRTANFEETPWMMTEPLRVRGETRGAVRVGYLQKRPDRAEGPFVREERALLRIVATWLGWVAGQK